MPPATPNKASVAANRNNPTKLRRKNRIPVSKFPKHALITRAISGFAHGARARDNKIDQCCNWIA
jgi:hypothetical protein